MAKILTDKELGKIIYDACTDPSVIEEADSYQYFLEDLGELICHHFGGERGQVIGLEEGDLNWTVSFYPNDSLPSDGGVFKDYDVDVIWCDGEEVD